MISLKWQADGFDLDSKINGLKYIYYLHLESKTHLLKLMICYKDWEKLDARPTLNVSS